MENASERWQTIKKLFAAALDKAPEDRMSFLHESSIDSSIRAEVERLLINHEQAGSFLSGQAIDLIGVPNLTEGDLLAGRFKIIKFVAAGGMGQVYKARDNHLGRTIALKLVARELAEDRQAVVRLRREAKAASALTHPNICTIYDFVEVDGKAFIAMEFLEGETLASRIRRGPLLLSEALKISTDISSGLAAAHASGIIHRDLKPGNIMLTRAGTKLLDFGLAKQSRAPQEEQASTALSNEAMIAGTVPYMSPEQIRGEPLDQRTDIFAFGAILYEMLGGRPAFHGATWVETASAVLREEPPELITDSRDEIPLSLKRITRCCIEKNREDRIQSAKDLWFMLNDIRANSANPQAPTLDASLRARGFRAIWALLSFLALTTVVVLLILWSRGDHSLPQYERVTFRNEMIVNARFGPDEQAIIYSAMRDGAISKVYRSNVDGTDLRALDLPPSDLFAVSHSGDIAILTETGSSNGLAQAPLNGGAPRQLLDNVIAADWSPDGAQLAVVRDENGKRRLEYPVGNRLYETIGTISHVRISPEGDAIAFMDHPLRGDDRGTVAIVDLVGQKRTLTSEWVGEQGLAWSPDGKEVWFTATGKQDWDRRLYAVSRSGQQRLVLRIPGALYLEDIAPDGRVLLLCESRRYEVAGGTVGKKSTLISWAEIMTAAAISRDGKFALLTDLSSTSDYSTYLAKLDGSQPIQLGKGIAQDVSPDDKWVATILPTRMNEILLFPTGAGMPKTITSTKLNFRVAKWAGDGLRLVTLASQSNGPLRYWLQDINGGSPRPITPEGVDGDFITVNHVAYICAKDMNGIGYLYPIDGGEPKRIETLAPSDLIVGGDVNSEAIFVSSDRKRPEFPSPPQFSRQVVKVNLPTGRREDILDLLPVDSVGVVSVYNPMLSDDARHYIYSQVREQSVMYVVAGLK